ncbi:MAG: group II intron reverse transcriptase/maturase [Oscillospiraceae bacterium]|jgi:group II intron reverse transcriptase/maturase|nr:group II intron reverse transcriptase/maturase [Oscillospiraceae bacterium]
MQPTVEILEKINQNSLKHPNEVFTRLFRYMLRPDLYFTAYKNLYANNGASTKGIDNDTADGFSKEYVENIINKLRDGSFTPKPTRRIHIPKTNGTNRPISIPTFTDKLVQEAMRMILEAVYEPTFKGSSHGFRPKRSCHTALEQIKRDFTGVRWFIEGDIKGCFDNIDHKTLVTFINRKIKDAQFIQLLGKFLKAGYLENWKYHKTFSGTPQGGIISPLLANIYLHELDKYVAKLATEFEKPRERVHDPRYSKLMHEIRAVKTKLDRADEASKLVLLQELKTLRRKLRQTPCKSQTDKRLAYIRYADDTLFGIVGNREDCAEVKRKLIKFVSEVLKMELNTEKTLITHSNNYARFLGYDVRVRRDNTVKRTKSGRLVRTLHNKVELNIPLTDKIEKFLFSHNIVWQKLGKLVPCRRNELLHLSDSEIITAYNSELRGICNYYNLASNFNTLHYFSYIMEYSCLKTLASKYKSCVKKIISKYKDGKSWSIPYNTKKGKRRVKIATYQDCTAKMANPDIIPTLTIKHLHSRNSFEARLNAKICELCGSTASAYYEIHHINKLKNLKGKVVWEQIMIARRRKTLVVCRECHKRIHGKKMID